MSRKSNLAQTSVIACALPLLLSSTAWAAVVAIHIVVPVVHPKVPVVIVKPNVPKIAITTGIGSQIGSQSSGAGAGKVKYNSISIVKQVDPASPSLLKDAMGGKTKGLKVDTVGKSTVVGGDKGETVDGAQVTTIAGPKGLIVGDAYVTTVGGSEGATTVFGGGTVNWGNPVGVTDHPIIGSLWNGTSPTVGGTGSLGGNAVPVRVTALGVSEEVYDGPLNPTHAGVHIPLGLGGSASPVVIVRSAVGGTLNPSRLGGTGAVNWGDAGPVGGAAPIAPIGGNVVLENSTVGPSAGGVTSAGPVTLTGSGAPPGGDAPLKVGEGTISSNLLTNGGSGAVGGNVPVNVGEVSVGGGAISGK
jgi:hypothetical protein